MKLAARAVAEMTCRWQADGLTPEQLHRLAEACLAEQARPGDRKGVCIAAVNLIDALYVGDLLSDEQSERYFAQMVQFSPLVRPVVVQGQPFYAGVRVKRRGPMNRYRARLQIEDISIGTSPRESFRRGHFGGGDGFPTFYCENARGRVVEFSRLGTHPVEVDLSLTINERELDRERKAVEVYRPWSWEEHFNGFNLYAARRTIKGTVEIVAEEPADLFKMTHSPELDQAVAGRVSVSEVYVLPADRELRGRVICPGPHPIGLAFDVYAEFAGKRVHLAQFMESKDWGIGRCGFSFPIPECVPETITIILRSSKDIALPTPDLYELWDGELWFEGVEVVHDEEPPKSWKWEGRFKPQVRRRDLSESESQWPVTKRMSYHWPYPAHPVGPPASVRFRPPPPDRISRGAPDNLSESAVRTLTDDIRGAEASSEITSRSPAREPTPADVETMLPEERDEYFRRMVEFSLLARPVVVAGQEFYVGVDWEDDAPRDQFELYVKVKEIRVGELRTLGVGSGLRTPLGFSRRGHGLTGVPTSLGKYIELDQPGSWPVELDLECQIYHDDGPSTWVTDGSELYSGKRTLTRRIEVLAEEPPGLFTLTHSAKLDRAVAAALRATDFRAEDEIWVNGRPQPGLSVQVWFYEPLPIGVAFEAFAEFGGQRLKAERTLVLSLGGTALGSRGIPVTFACSSEPPKSVTLILSASKSVATRTPDIYQIWDGELRFEDLPVLPGSDRERRFGDGRYAPTVRHPERSQSDAAGDGEP